MMMATDPAVTEPGAPDNPGTAPPDSLVQQMHGLQFHVAATLKTASTQMMLSSGVAPRTSLNSVLPEVNLPEAAHEPPSTHDIQDYARYLGMDVEADADLLYIAEWALTAPVPEGWTVHIDHAGHEFFHHSDTNTSSYHHPLDQQYREMYEKKKKEKLQK